MSHCGKDQCDRVSAAAKTIIRSYVDAKNNVEPAEEIYEALHYGKGMKDAAVSVIMVENRDPQGTKISGIQNYHLLNSRKRRCFGGIMELEMGFHIHIIT